MVYTVARGVDNNLLMRLEKRMIAIPIVLAVLAMSALIIMKPGGPHMPGTDGGPDTTQPTTNTTPSVNIKNTGQKSTAPQQSDSSDGNTSQTGNPTTSTRQVGQASALEPVTLAQTTSSTPTVGGTGGDAPATNSPDSTSGTTSNSGTSGDSTLALPLTICVGKGDSTSSLLDISSDHICIN